MGDLKDWILAIISHWQYWLSGGGLGGLVVLIAGVIERLRGKAMSNATYILIFVVFFLVGASFMAWRSEHHALIDERIAISALRDELQAEREKNRPQLTGQIFDLARVDSANVTGIIPELREQLKTVVILRAAIANNGSPTIVKNWRLVSSCYRRENRTGARDSFADGKIDYGCYV